MRARPSISHYRAMDDVRTGAPVFFADDRAAGRRVGVCQRDVLGDRSGMLPGLDRRGGKEFVGTRLPRSVTLTEGGTRVAS
jgi:hypothetical protein